MFIYVSINFSYGQIPSDSVNLLETDTSSTLDSSAVLETNLINIPHDTLGISAFEIEFEEGKLHITANQING